jgi:hypothetical protein
MVYALRLTLNLNSLMKTLILFICFCGLNTTNAQTYLVTKDSIFKCSQIEAKGNSIHVLIIDSTLEEGSILRIFSFKDQIDFIVFDNANTKWRFENRNLITGFDHVVRDDKIALVLDSLENGPIDVAALRQRLGEANPKLSAFRYDRVKQVTSLNANTHELISATAKELYKFQKRHVGAIIVSAITTTVVVILPLVGSTISAPVLIGIVTSGSVIALTLHLSGYYSMKKASEYLEAASPKIMPK